MHAEMYMDFIIPYTLTDALHSLKYMVGVSYLVRRSAEDPEGLQGGGILTVHLPALQLHVGNIHSQCCGSASLSCGSGFSFSLWCGSGSYISLWCGSWSRSNWCRSGSDHSLFSYLDPICFKLPTFHFDADPDPASQMMRIQIRTVH